MTVNNNLKLGIKKLQKQNGKIQMKLNLIIQLQVLLATTEFFLTSKATLTDLLLKLTSTIKWFGLDLLGRIQSMIK